MRKIIALLLSMILLCSLAGCGARREADAPAVTTPPETPESVESTPPEEVWVDPRPEVIRVIVPGVENLDPVNVDEAGKSCLCEVYEPLFDILGDGTVQCVLADGERGDEGGYEHDKGSYTLFLREGVYDHEGNPLTAEDVAFCITRRAQEEGWKLFTSAEAGEENTVVVSFSRELSGAGEWEQHFASLYLYTEQAYHDHEGLLTSGCGTGPYRVSDYAEGESMTLIPFADYWQGEERTERGGANVQSIEYLFLDDAAEQVVSLEVGRADMLEGLRYADTVDFTGEGSYADLFHVEGSWSSMHYYLVPNQNNLSRMKDQNLRLGLFYAVDNARLADFCGEGGARACEGLGNPDDADLPGAGESYESVTLPVDEVRTYLRRAAYVNEGLKLLTVAGGVEEELACAIQSILRPLSINAIIVAVDEEEFTSRLNNPGGGLWDIAILSMEGYSAAEAWKKLWTDRVSSGFMVGSLRDAGFNNVLAPLAEKEGRTEENLGAVQQYAMERGYAMALVQLYRPAVVTNRCERAVFNGSGALLPGACVYHGYGEK